MLDSTAARYNRCKTKCRTCVLVPVGSVCIVFSVRRLSLFSSQRETKMFPRATFKNSQKPPQFHKLHHPVPLEAYATFALLICRSERSAKDDGTVVTCFPPDSFLMTTLRHYSHYCIPYQIVDTVTSLVVRAPPPPPIWAHNLPFPPLDTSELPRPGW